MKDMFLSWSLIVSIIKRFESIALSHSDIAFAFIFLRIVVISFTPLASKSASKALLKYPLSPYNLSLAIRLLYTHYYHSFHFAICLRRVK